MKKIDRLLHPATICVVGISTKKINIGRIILDNILAAGFSRENLPIIHPEAGAIDGISTISHLIALKEKVDLMILAVNGAQVPIMIEEILQNSLAESAILISGGIGEQQDQQHLVRQIQENILAARKKSSQAPIFLGANSLGILSQPGRYPQCQGNCRMN
ncbi:hypothetical protein JCM39068_15860 [Desulfocastanea catecholica]